MSQAPYTLARAESHLGPLRLEDSLLKDGLLNPYDGRHMGELAEECVRKYKFDKKAQDDFAKSSYEKYFEALKKGFLKSEIIPVEVKKKKQSVIVEEDEQPSKTDYERIDKARAVFEKEGTITAGNASKINDGAAFLILASEKACKKEGLKPLARVVDYVGFAGDPTWFSTAPIQATRLLLEKNNLKVGDIDLFEINEAFSAVALASEKDLSIPREKLNVHGGAVALGHPIGASGARIVVTLVHALKTHNKKRGLASICLGGGEALSMLVERVD